MAIILNIDTAGETASVCLSRDAEVIKLAINDNQKDHAAWLHPATREMIKEAGVHINQLNAVAVSIGPGSYTGLRVGLSAAKGLCYALDIPLIAIGTLELMASSVNKEAADLFCPLIDARRMEVFMAMYDRSLQEIIQPCAMIIDETSFADLLLSHKVCFCGSGSKKLQKILDHDHALFGNNTVSAADMVPLARKSFREKSFADTAYTEPLYIKEFYSPARKPPM
jgi:tRNA threonylcarbamoyladenosine biosynthesis protein TsaB